MRSSSQGVNEDGVRRRIVAAAREHFFAHGFRGVTMDHIAEELGMSKKTLYAHFPSKAALVQAMMLDKFERLETDLQRIAGEAADDFLKGLHRLLACVHQHTEELRPSFIRDVQREGADLFKVVETRRRELIRRYFRILFENGRRQGRIRKDVPVPVVIEILLGAVQAIMNPARLDELKLTPTAGFEAILSVILEGIITSKARSST